MLQLYGSEENHSRAKETSIVVILDTYNSVLHFFLPLAVSCRISIGMADSRPKDAKNGRDLGGVSRHVLI